MDNRRKRRLLDAIMKGVCALSVLAAIVPLASLVAYIVARGMSGLSWSVLAGLPAPVGEAGGGFGNAILGSLVLVGLACLAAIPAGVLAGICLAERGDDRFGRIVRFGIDVLSGVPSIITGIFVYTLVVLPMGGFSALAGAVALGILMLPTIIRVTGDVLGLVPASLREAGLALGVPWWRVTLKLVLRAAAPGIATGVMLAVARAAGETAPLLFTAFNSRFWSVSPVSPIGSLPVQIYTYAMSPHDDWHRQAWAAALVLVVLVVVPNIGARVLLRSHGRSGS